MKMNNIQRARDYAKKNNIKLTKHKNGDVSIYFKKRHQGGSHENFWNNILRLMRGINRRLGDDYEYIPSPNNFRGRYPDKIIDVTFNKRTL